MGLWSLTCGLVNSHGTEEFCREEQKMFIQQNTCWFDGMIWWTSDAPSCWRSERLKSHVWFDRAGWVWATPADLWNPDSPPVNTNTQTHSNLITSSPYLPHADTWSSRHNEAADVCLTLLPCRWCWEVLDLCPPERSSDTSQSLQPLWQTHNIIQLIMVITLCVFTIKALKQKVRKRKSEQRKTCRCWVFNHSEMKRRNRREILNKCRSQTDRQINGELNRDAPPHHRIADVSIIITVNKHTELTQWTWNAVKSFLIASPNLCWSLLIWNSAENKHICQVQPHSPVSGDHHLHPVSPVVIPFHTKDCHKLSLEDSRNHRCL